MQRTPPDILITNYSMLEYLLIRPDDSPLFDQGRARHWEFLVLDEAHQYRGAKGMEMAMLLRRLKDRLREGGRQGDFSCIATSASLSSEPQARERVAEFASALFEAPFEPEDVVLASVEPVDFEVAADVAPEPGRYEEYLQRIHSGQLAPSVLFERLRSDATMARLNDRLRERPWEASKLAVELFPGIAADEAVRALEAMIQCAVTAMPAEGRLPLLPIRYHYFLRALEGVRLSLWPELSLRIVGHGDGRSDSALAVDLVVCQNCGQHYFKGRLELGRWAPAIQDPSSRDYRSVVYFPLTGPVDRREAGEALSALERSEYYDPEASYVSVCLECGAAAYGELPGCDHLPMVWLEELEADKEGRFRCRSCERSRRNLFHDVSVGLDGPHVVIATTLFSQLPKERRKILAFADSRQRAAFVAWYLGESYAAIARRHALYGAVTRRIARVDDVDLRDAVEVYCQEQKALQLTDPSWSRGILLHYGWRDVLQEVIGGDDPHSSLERTGLLYGRVALPPWWDPDALALEFGLGPESVIEATQWLWQTMVENYAVEVPDEAGDWDSLELGVPQGAAILGGSSRGSIRALDGPKTKRVLVLSRWLAHCYGDPDHPERFVQTAPRFIGATVEYTLRAQAGQPEQGHLLLAVKGEGYRINLGWWRFYWPEHPGHERPLRQCTHCRHLSFWQLADVCPTYRCTGRLVLVDGADLERNHYRRLYQEPLPGVLRVEEHTAQIERSEALAYQKDFKAGQIGVLSSSTTFELGVDLGDLDVVFLRNVPPEIFNYAQRVGRAGRRPGYPGIAVTYCSSSPHDLFHFEHPERLILGQTNPPVLRINNPRLVLRHWTAVVLSLFFRTNPERFHSVASFFGNMERPDILQELRDYVSRNASHLQQLFQRIIPEPLQEELADTWVTEMLGEGSPFYRAVMEVASDWKQAEEFEARSRDQRRYKDAEWGKRRAREIASQDVLAFLSRRVIIPKYGFPVDVVELTLASESNQAKKITLQRDLSLAIAEFAPKSQVIANKWVWTSEAVKQVPEMEWPRYRYRCCTRHGMLDRRPPGESFEQEPCCHEMRLGEYIVPVFGFMTRKDGQRPRGPLERLFTTRPFWVRENRWGAPASRLALDGHVRVEAYTVEPGWIVMLSQGHQGSGFYVCPSCGRGDLSAIQKRHDHPRGGHCEGKALHPLAMAHEFLTDVLRIDFPGPMRPPAHVAWGAAYALTFSGAELLEVPPTDLNCIAFDAEPLSILLYDNVPGGAGLVSQLSEPSTLRTCLEMATQRLAGSCGCKEEESCYGCLRSYSNQFLHHELERGATYAFLQSLKAAELDLVPLE